MLVPQELTSAEVHQVARFLQLAQASGVVSRAYPPRPKLAARAVSPTTTTIRGEASGAPELPASDGHPCGQVPGLLRLCGCTNTPRDGVTAVERVDHVAQRFVVAHEGGHVLERHPQHGNCQQQAQQSNPDLLQHIRDRRPPAAAAAAKARPPATRPPAAQSTTWTTTTDPALRGHRFVPHWRSCLGRLPRRSVA